MTYRYFSAVLLCLLASFSFLYSDAWDSRNNPDNISEINCLSVSGEDLYLGTKSDGVFYSPDLGLTWNKANEKIDGEEVLEIITSDDGSLLVVSGLFTLSYSDNHGMDWRDINHFKLREETILGAVFRGKYIFVATNKDVYVSDNVGEKWTNLTENVGIREVFSFDVDHDNVLFVCIDGERDGIHISGDMGENWELINKGFEEPPVVPAFTIDRENLVYAAVDGSVYRFDRESGSWESISPKFETIKDLENSERGHLIVSDSRNLAIYNKDEDNWIREHEDLEFEDRLKDLKFGSDDKVLVVTDKNTLISRLSIGDWIKELVIRWDIKVVDFNNNPIKNKQFALYKMFGNNSHGWGNISTDNNGYFTLTSKDFAVGNGVKLEKIVHTEAAMKPGHNDVDNAMYYVKIDNAVLDANGAHSWEVLQIGQNHVIKMGHTTVMYNLVASIEWDAKPVYFDSLQLWMQHMSNYLYDVSDGQMYINKMAVYDDGFNWRRCDVRFYANNQVWPNAHVGGIKESWTGFAHLPRKWYGNGTDTRNFTARQDWLTTYNDYHYTTIAHELGHYMLKFYDEYVYVDSVKGSRIPKTYIFGFMDYQYPNGNAWSSEMSNPTRYINNDYETTAQYHWNGSDCWNDFENKFEKTYNGIYCPIIKPSERNNLGGNDYFLGPNNGTVNEDVGFLLDFRTYDKFSNAGHVETQCKDNQSNLLPNTHVILQKSNKKIYQGKSADNSMMITLGAETGDFLYLTNSNQLNFQYYFKRYTIKGVTSNEKNKGDEIQEPVEVVLDQIDGNYSMVSGLEFVEDGRLVFTAQPNVKFSGEPFVETTLEDEVVKNVISDYDMKELRYKAEMDEAMVPEGMFVFNAMDDSENEFPVLMSYNITPFMPIVSGPEGLVRLFPGEKSPDIEHFAILSSSFPPPRDGLDMDAEQAGNTFSVSYHPDIVDMVRKIPVWVSYPVSDLSKKPEESLRLHQWNGADRKWHAISGFVDTLRKEVGSEISMPGIYGLFTVNSETGVGDEEDYGSLELEIGPNPAAGVANLTFSTLKPSEVSLMIYDLLGREVGVVYNSFMDASTLKIEHDVSGMAAGVYLVVMKSGSKTITRMLTVKK